MRKKSSFTSKGQLQKFARQILSSYQVDLSMLQISCSTRSINLIGTLIGIDGNELASEEIRSLINELSKAGTVQSNLDNWDFNGGAARKIGKNANKSFHEDEDDDLY